MTPTWGDGGGQRARLNFQLPIIKLHLIPKRNDKYLKPRLILLTIVGLVQTAKITMVCVKSLEMNIEHILIHMNAHKSKSEISPLIILLTTCDTLLMRFYFVSDHSKCLILHTTPNPFRTHTLNYRHFKLL